jgi:hypothetical protein
MSDGERRRRKKGDDIYRDAAYPRAQGNAKQSKAKKGGKTEKMEEDENKKKGLKNLGGETK